MTISINELEAIWIATTSLALILTFIALIDAWADRRTVRQQNGRAREIQAGGNVRREADRVIVDGLLLFVAVPGIFSARETTLNPIVVALMAVPFVLLFDSAADAFERRKLNAEVAKAASL